MKYVALIEQADDGGFGGYVPDLPGLGVAGYATPNEAVESLRAALVMHLEGMRQDGQLPLESILRRELAHELRHPI